MDIPGSQFVSMLAERLAEVLPQGFAVVSGEDSLWLDARDGFGGGMVWGGDVDDDVRERGDQRYADAASMMLSTVQDNVCVTLRDPWPRAAGPRLAMADPWATVRDGVLHLGYGDETAPVVRLRPIPLRQVFTHRLATRDDLPALRALMDAAIAELQTPFLDEVQIEASRTIMGLDTQLVDDGTYFVIETEGAIVGCGGWSRRQTLYGGDESPGRSAALLDPAREPARVRAMYTHPAHTRKGIGRLVLSLCERAARADGFPRVELMATMAGVPLYRACGYEPIEDVVDERGGAPVPLVRMGKSLPG